MFLKSSHRKTDAREICGFKERERSDRKTQGKKKKKDKNNPFSCHSILPVRY